MIYLKILNLLLAIINVVIWIFYISKSQSKGGVKLSGFNLTMWIIQTLLSFYYLIK